MVDRNSWGGGGVFSMSQTLDVFMNEAAKKVDQETQKKMGAMMGGLGLPPGMF